MTRHDTFSAEHHVLVSLTSRVCTSENKKETEVDRRRENKRDYFNESALLFLYINDTTKFNHCVLM